MGLTFVAFGVFALLLGSRSGVWWALIGWFIVAGSAGERYAGLAERMLGMTVRDVMTTPPTLAPSWFTLSAFVAHLSAREAGQPAFAVVGFNGESEGVLLARDLNRVPPAERDALRVRDIRQKRIQPLIVTPTTPLAEVMPAIRAHGGVAVVVEDSRLIATLVTADLDHAAGRVRQAGRRI